MKLIYRIMGIPSRTENINKLKSQLDISDDNIFIDHECHKNPMWTWKNTVQLPNNDNCATHMVIIQDDAILCNDFNKFCEYLIKRFPDAIWMLYNHKKLFDVKEMHLIIRPGCCMGGVVSIIPIKYISEIIKLQETEYPDYLHDDKFIHFWANNNGVDVFSTFPSVIGTNIYESSLSHVYGKEYKRCYNPLDYKWLNATVNRYSKYNWSKLEN